MATKKRPNLFASAPLQTPAAPTAPTAPGAPTIDYANRMTTSVRGGAYSRTSGLTTSKGAGANGATSLTTRESSSTGTATWQNTQETPAEVAARTQLQYDMQLSEYDRRRREYLQGEALGFKDTYMAEWQQAKDRSVAGLDDVLGQLDAVGAGYGEDWMAATLGREAAAWEARTQQAMSAISQEYAAMGRVASPNVLAYVRRRMAAQEADALQMRRMQLEQERSQFQLQSAQTRIQAYASHDNQVQNLAVAASLLAQIAS